MGNSCRKFDVLKCEQKTRGGSALCKCILYIAHLSILLSDDVCLQLGLCFEQFNLIMLKTLSPLSDDVCLQQGLCFEQFDLILLRTLSSIDDVCLQQGCVVVFQVFGYLS